MPRWKHLVLLRPSARVSWEARPFLFPVALAHGNGHNPGMDAKDLRCDPYPADEETPDGLRGTPAQRFTEAARRVFSVSKERVAELEAAEQAKTPAPDPARLKPGRPARAAKV